MFSFKPFTPCPILQPFVERYLIVKMNTSGDCNQTLIPSNNQNIGFILHGSIKSRPFDPDAMISRSYVMGQITEAETATYYKELEVFSILFKPAGMYRLFGIPMNEFANCGVDFELIAGTEGKELVEKIFESKDYIQRIAQAEAFLIRQLTRNVLYLSNRISYASNLILQQSGTIPIQRLAYKINMCERNFERHFINEVGVSPKTFSRIARMKRAMQMIENMPKLTWSDITYHLNYSDQAHFIHDFKKMSGKTPSDYYNSITDFEHFLYSG